MELNHNDREFKFDGNTHSEFRYPTTPKDNSVIYMLLKDPLIPHDSIWFLNTFLAKKKFDKYDNSRFDIQHIWEKLRETYTNTQFIGMETDIILEIIDKLYDYYTEYKKSILDDIDALDKFGTRFIEYRTDRILATGLVENKTDRILGVEFVEDNLDRILGTEFVKDDLDKVEKEEVEAEYRQAYKYAFRDAEEYLIEMLKMKYTLDSGIKNDEFYLDKLRLRVEKLILDYFGDFEREKKYLDDLEEKYKTAINEFMLDYFGDFECKSQNLEKEYETKINELLKNCETNSNISKEEIELKMLNNFGIKQRRDVARQCIGRLKNEIYRLVRGFDVILSKDLLSKLGKYQEFSELLLENDNKISPFEVVE